MQEVNSTYREIFDSGDYISEAYVVINGVTYQQSKLYSMCTRKKLFKEKKPMFGNAIAGEIEISMEDPEREIPRGASIKPYFRLRSGNKVSPWYQKGEFFINTREADDETGRLEIYGYDALRKAERDYPSSTLSWTATSPNAYAVVKEIVAHMFGVSYSTVNGRPTNYIEQDTITKLQAATHIIGFPAQYTMREVLESIATMYGGNFIMSDTGKLSLVGFVDMLEETFYLITENGRRITFGGTRILLRA